jgi:hypothetical protein
MLAIQILHQDLGGPIETHMRQQQHVRFMEDFSDLKKRNPAWSAFGAVEIEVNTLKFVHFLQDGLYNLCDLHVSINAQIDLRSGHSK